MFYNESLLPSISTHSFSKECVYMYNILSSLLFFKNYFSNYITIKDLAKLLYEYQQTDMTIGNILSSRPTSASLVFQNVM